MTTNDLRIVPFEDQHAAAFHDLNVEWIAKFFTVEDEDRRLLENPQRNIIEPGGSILIAMIGDRVVGTCALIPLERGHYELAKMCAASDLRGQGIGKRLLHATIEHARDIGATLITLLSSRKLDIALDLYRKAGFVETEDAPGMEHYTRCDIAMQLRLEEVAS